MPRDDGNREIFLFDTTSGLFTQITNTTGSSFLRGGGNRVPTINATGTRIAFMSDRDLTPGNPGNTDGHFEIFLAGRADGIPPVPTLSASMQIAVAALLLIAGLHFIRRRPA